MLFIGPKTNYKLNKFEYLQYRNSSEAFGNMYPHITVVNQHKVNAIIYALFYRWQYFGESCVKVVSISDKRRHTIIIYRLYGILMHSKSQITTMEISYDVNYLNQRGAALSEKEYNQCIACQSFCRRHNPQSQLAFVLFSMFHEEFCKSSALNEDVNLQMSTGNTNKQISLV